MKERKDLLIFFSDKEGITSTKANFLANMAKESIQTELEALKGVRFVSSFVSVLGSDVKTPLQIGQSLEDYNKINLDRVSMMNAFCAWMREAIKAKDVLLQIVNNMNSENYRKDNNIELPDYSIFEKVNTEWAIGQWSIGKRMSYYKLEAIAATIGKQIHPDSPLATAIKKVRQVNLVPNKMTQEGGVNVVYNYQSTENIENLEKKFFQLQELHRKNEAQLNVMKQEILDMIEAENKKRNDEIQAARKLYNDKVKEVELEFIKWRDSEIARISKLKIIIPNELKEIFDELNKRVEIE